MADDTQRIAILLQARDKDLQRAMDRSNKLIAKFEKQTGRAMTQSARTVESNMSRAGKAIQTFARGAAVAIGVRLAQSVVQGTARIVQGIAQIGDEARRSGLGVEAFQELSFVAQQTRIPVDALIDGMKELSLRADEFVTTGGGSAAEAFRRIGLSAAELKDGLEAPQELLLDIIDRMEDLDRAAQIRVADEIFGGTGGERFVELLAQGEGGIRQLMQRAHEVGAVLDQEMIQKADELNRRFSELTTRISTGLKTAVVAVADEVAGIRREFEDIGVAAERAANLIGEDVAKEIENIPGGVSEIRDEVEGLNLDFDSLAETVRRAARAMSDEVSTLVDLGLEKEAIALADLSDALSLLVSDWQANRIASDEFVDKLADVVSQSDAAVSALEEIDGVEMGFVTGQLASLQVVLGNVTARAVEAADAIRQAAQMPALPTIGAPLNRSQLDAYQQYQTTRSEAPGGAPTAQAVTTSRRPNTRPNDIDFGMPPLLTGGGVGCGGGGSARPSEWAREVEALGREIKALEAEAASFLVAAEYGRELGDAAEFARKRAELLVAAQESGREITAELTQEIEDLARSYIEAAEGAEAAERALDRMRENAERGTDALGDMFTAILDGSKSAKEALADLLMQIAKVQLQQGVARLVGGVPGVGLLGGLLGGARANGGPVAAGVPYLVNERTANSEVFVPGRGGAVLSVPQAQAALRGQGQGARAVVDVRLHTDQGVTIEQVDQRATGVAVRVVDGRMRSFTESRRRS